MAATSTDNPQPPIKWVNHCICPAQCKRKDREFHDFPVPNIKEEHVIQISETLGLITPLDSALFRTWSNPNWDTDLGVLLSSMCLGGTGGCDCKTVESDNGEPIPGRSTWVLLHLIHEDESIKPEYLSQRKYTTAFETLHNLCNYPRHGKRLNRHMLFPNLPPESTGSLAF